MSAKTVALIITSCGKRKRLPPAPGLRAADLEAGSTAAVAARWAASLKAAEPRLRAADLYCGRAFRDAKAAAAAIEAPLFVLSAGLGLVAEEERVPSYCLTVAQGPDSVLERLLCGESSARGWWDALARARGTMPLRAVQAETSGPILIAAGASYLQMIERELLALEATDRSRLRLFTGRGRAALPPPLQPFVMPYDRRLEVVAKGRSGAMSDFAQRALRHFVETVLIRQPLGDHHAHGHAVAEALAGLEAPAKKRGQSKTDAEIIRLIRANLAAVGANSSAMLAFLRNSLNVACEQGRFRKLYATATMKLAA